MRASVTNRVINSFWTLPAILNLIIVVNSLISWPIVKLSGIKQPQDYGDLRIILRAADCYSEYGNKIYLETSGNCVYNYGQPLIWFFRIFHLGESNTNVVAVVLMILTTSLFAILIRLTIPKFSPLTFAFVIFIFCSPPVMLLFERANIDTLIFCLLCSAIILTMKQNIFAGYVLIALTALFKFYTLPLVYFYMLRFRRHSLLTKITLFVSMILTTAIVTSDLRSTLKGFSIPNPMFYAYGSSKIGFGIGHIIGIEFNRITLIILGALFNILIAIVAHLRYRETLQGAFNRSSFSPGQIIVVIIFCQAFLVTWFTGMNYIYRLILVIPVLIIFLFNSSQYRRTYCAIVVCAIWLSPWFRGLELVGDAALVILTSHLSLWLFLNRSNLTKTDIA